MRFEVNFEFVADQLESVALVLLVPHALVVWDVRVWLPTLKFLAMGAVILLVVRVGVTAASSTQR